MNTCFKVNTGADGNLLPLAEFFKHFPNVNMTQLAKTIDSSTKLYAYNNTEIKQLGVCELLVEYQNTRKMCKFYVVDFPTAILGTHDSESPKLITVDFNSVEAETSHLKLSDNSSLSTPMYVNALQNNADPDEFSIMNTKIYSLVLKIYEHRDRYQTERRCHTLCSTNSLCSTCLTGAFKT